ncbi:hypothetical protein EV126DRAFT_426848 [Verticillium dahliae]|nr:hypothetical protein EV126DRAFT_435484 [Verticillium dahliae]KAH6696034.1 hypothetical protein EV126DRAFT_426848 [Verticillium dahliae]
MRPICKWLSCCCCFFTRSSCLELRLISSLPLPSFSVAYKIPRTCLALSLPCCPHFNQVNLCHPYPQQLPTFISR